MVIVLPTSTALSDPAAAAVIVLVARTKLRSVKSTAVYLSPFDLVRVAAAWLASSVSCLVTTSMVVPPPPTDWTV